MTARDRDTAVQALRAATRADHAAVDDAFSRFGIDSPEGYARFLEAHARVLPEAERRLAPGDLVGGWQARAGLLAGDLAAAGVEMPPPLAFSLPPGEAARWGAIYVMEGSRLGGAVLARMVPVGWPAAYLGAVHGPRSWRGLLAALDRADSGDAWRAEAIAGAKAMFNAYSSAARV